MSNIYTTPPASGEIRRDWYGGCQIETYRQRCTLVTGSDRFVLGYQLPPRSKVVSALILQQTAVVTGTMGNALVTAQANCIALVNAGTNVASNWTAATATGATASFLVTASGASTAITNNPPVIDGLLNTNVGTAYRAHINTSTNSLNLILAPAVTTTTTGVLNLSGAGAASTNGFRFGTDSATSSSNAGVVDVVITVQRFSDTGV